MSNRYLVENKITNDYVEAYSKTTYRIIGKNKHSAIKPCHWLEQRLMTGRDNRNCYKGFFGIKSNRCLQNSPSLPFCSHQCVFCWRDSEISSLGSEFLVEPDDPKDLVEEMIKHHKNIIENHLPLKRYLDNYDISIDILYFMLLNDSIHNIDSLSEGIHVSKTKIVRAVNLLKNQKYLRPVDENLQKYILDKDVRRCIDSREEIVTLINRELTTPDEIMNAHNEALEPNHAAISLDGEPTLYPKLSGLVDEFKKRRMTTFIVTNGTKPDKIESLNPLPSQLYITLPAPNEELYKKVCRPMIKNGWSKINETLSKIPSLSCRTVIRLTAVKNLNINENYLNEYYKIIEKSNPNFFEIKGFTLQARALLIQERLKAEQPLEYFFPDYPYLQGLSKTFEKLSGFPLIYSNETSRDFLFAVNWDKEKDPIIKLS